MGRKVVESEQGHNSTEMVLAQDDQDRIGSLIESHRALATALEIKNALGTIVLQQDETLSKLLDFQRKYANLKGRLTQLQDRVEELESFLEEPVIPEESERDERVKGVKGKPYK